MYALVKFLVDEVKATVPVKDIKNFDADSQESDRIYEVFWKSPNDEATGYRYAVVLYVAETEKQITHRRKRARLPSWNRLDELLATKINDAKKSMMDEEHCRRNKELEARLSVNEKDKLKEISKLKLKRSKRSKSLSQSSDDESGPGSICKVQKNAQFQSLNQTSDEDDLVLKSEVTRIKEKYKIVLYKLKLKQEENTHLKKRNDQLQDLNISLNTKLLSLLNTNATESTPKSLEQNPFPPQELPTVLGTAEENFANPEIETHERGSLLEHTVPSYENPSTSSCHGQENVQVAPIKQELESPLKETTESTNKSLGQNQSPPHELPKVLGAAGDDFVNPEIETHERGSLLVHTAPLNETPSTSGSHGQENVQVAPIKQELESPLKKSNPSLLNSNANGLYLHNNGSLMKWKNGRMELAPGVFIKEEQWKKILSSKTLNVSRLTRNLAVSLWGSECLKERSVTGAACRRFIKDSVLAKRALTPMKVDAIQNGLRFWLKEIQHKDDMETLKLTSTTAVRKMLSTKIMDLSKHKKNLSEKFKHQ